MTADIVARARACVGARFRPQGRSVAEGMDCAGVAGAAFGLDALPRDYALRGALAARAETFAATAGLRRIAPDEAGPGDLMMVAAGPAQLHLVVLTDGGFVHADAALRRVVERPGRPAWPVLTVWRKD